MNADNADDNADKWMLRIANGGLLSFDSYTSGSWVKKLKLNEANGALTINEAYTLPTTVTSQNDYVLTAQTDGTTAWAAASGGGGLSTHAAGAGAGAASGAASGRSGARIGEPNMARTEHGGPE